MTKKTTKKSPDTKIRTMKQGQQRIKLDIKKSLPSSPPLPLPFPPTQKVEQIVAKLVAKPKLARFPNAFIMYRNEYVQYLKSKGYHISMTELSPMISTSWKKESEFVKDTYTKLSSEAEKMYVRDTGNTPQQINYKYSSTSQRALTSKIDSKINTKLGDPSHQSPLHVSNFGNDNIFENFELYDPLIRYSYPNNEFSRNYNNNNNNNLKESDEIPYHTFSTELSKYSNLQAQEEDCFPTENFIQWSSNISNIPSPIHHITSVPYDPSFSPNSNPLDDLMNSSNIIEGLSSLNTQMLESISSASPSSSPSETSFEEFSLLFSSELEEGRFSNFSTPTTYSECQSPDLYLYPGQSFATTPHIAAYHNKI